MQGHELSHHNHGEEIAFTIMVSLCAEHYGFHVAELGAELHSQLFLGSAVW